ncbi:MAG: hypothetical protein IR159_08540 [Brevundimonas sp.]|nr:hypothetical protein [Brevundimonas sp.]
MVLQRLRARADGGQAVLASLHDLALAARFADRVAVLDHGAVVADSTPLQSLTPQVLDRAFGLSARWVDGPDGPLLSAGRRSDAAQGE